MGGLEGKGFPLRAPPSKGPTLSRPPPGKGPIQILIPSSGPENPGGDLYSSAYATQTVLMFTNSRIPKGESSRP
jgi:hypothetical protein